MECGISEVTVMGLKIERHVSIRFRVVSTFIMVLALVAQPLYGVLSSQVAQAAEPNMAPTVQFAAPTPAENSYVRGAITPHVVATDDYGMGSYYIRVWKNAFESGPSNLVVNNCYSAPGAYLLGTAQNVTCPTIDTTALATGKYVLSAQFLDGDNAWAQSLRTFNIDNVAPTLTVKPADSTGILAGNLFTKVSFKLQDNVKFENKYTINGVPSTVTSAMYGDANFITVGQRGAVYGQNTITLKDLAGNSTSYSFVLDNRGPTVTIKNGYLGSKEENSFRNVSFSLYDDYQVDKYVINGHVSDFTNNNWSDANFDNIKPYLINQGLNTLVLHDVLGNTTTYQFRYDTVAPTANIKYSNNNGNAVTKDDVTVTLEADEAISDIPGWDRQTDRKFTKIYSENGKHTVTIKDIAGNSTDVKYEVKRIDRINPVVNGVADGAFYNTSKTYSITEQSIQDIFVNGVKYNQNNAPYTLEAEGEYKLEVIDKAGNTSGVITFTIDKTNPQGTVSLSNNGLPTKNDVIATLSIAGGEVIKTIAGWTQVAAGVFQKDAPYTENGPHIVTIEDLAGNKTDIAYTVSGIDKVAPIVTIIGATRNSIGQYVITGTTSTDTVGVRVAVGGFDDDAVVTGSNWTYTTPVLAVGTYALSAEAIDAAGNTNTIVSQTPLVVAAQAVDVTTLPQLPTINSTLPATVTTAGQTGNAVGTQGNASIATTPIEQQEEILGAQTEKKTAALPLEATESGWKIFGLAWFWWLLILAALAAAWWFIAAYRKRNAEA